MLKKIKKSFFFHFKVRKTSVRMTEIKEYPFDLSDLKNKPSESVQAPEQPPSATQLPSRTPSFVSVPEKRKVSIMADADSKDRENLPSERYVLTIQYNLTHFYFDITIFRIMIIIM